MITVQPDALSDYVTRMFQAVGVPHADAAFTARSLVKTNLMGHDSHGVVRMPQYIAAIESGELNPRGEPVVTHETPVTALVDGRWSLGQITARFTVQTAMDKAQTHGLAMTAPLNCGHVGRLGEWVEQAAAQELIALAFCNSGGGGGLVTPHGGSQRCLGTDPIAAALPLRQQPPIVVDFATSVVAEGKIRVARNAGKTLAPGLILDAQGQPSVDPVDLYRDGMLLPAAGHKGYGLGLVMEFLGGVFTGRGCTIFPGFKPGNGVLFVVMRADLFQPLDAYYADAQRLVDAVLAVRPAPGGEGVMLPGEPERRNMAQRRQTGIPLDDATWSQLAAVAERLGVAFGAIGA